MHKQACWPDEVAASPSPTLNDISRLNATQVACVYQPRTVEEVQAHLEEAAFRNLQVVCRGTKHSMGGHSLVPNGIVLDMCYMNSVSIDAAASTATVGVGAIWADVITAANKHGKTPRTLQSYCSFSVGNF